MVNSNTILPAELQNLALKQPEKKENEGLGQDDFLELMLTQLRHQDPLNPADSGDFIAQMASFAQVSALADLNTSFATLSGSLQSSQALQASTIVGTTVLVPSDRAGLTAGTEVSGKIFTEDATAKLVLTISDTTGQTVKQINLGSVEAGLVSFTWDGLDSKGEQLASGTYKVEAASVNGDESVAQTVLVNAKVESVSLISGAEPLLNLDGLGTYSMNDVLEIM